MLINIMGCLKLHARHGARRALQSMLASTTHSSSRRLYDQMAWLTQGDTPMQYPICCQHRALLIQFAVRRR